MSRAPKRPRAAPPAPPAPQAAAPAAPAAPRARTFTARLEAHVAALAPLEGAMLGCVLEAPFPFEDMVAESLAEDCENHADEADEETQLGIESDVLFHMELSDGEMPITGEDFAPLQELVAKLEAEKKRLAAVFASRFFSDGAAGRLQDSP